MFHSFTFFDRRIMSDLVGFGWIWSDLIEFLFLVNSVNSVGLYRIRSDLVGFDRIWSDLVGFGRIRSVSVGVAPGRGPH